MPEGKTILALALAGGRGTRLHPLTAEHAKPALPFAGGYRIIDFVLSNLINSGISPIYVLAQYKPQSLIEHVRVVSDRSGSWIDVILPRREAGPDGFRGSADAVYQNLAVVDQHRPDVVAVFAADHVYRMDIGQMAEFHAAREADVTIAAVPVPLRAASSFGVIATRADGRVEDFQEKPECPVPIAARPSHAYASMGNYLFQPKVLAQALWDAHARGGYDFGHHVLPLLPRRHRCYAYDFIANRVPGIQPYEERGYWRDVGTVEAYLKAQRDVIGRQAALPTAQSALANPRTARRFCWIKHKWCGVGYVTDFAGSQWLSNASSSAKVVAAPGLSSCNPSWRAIWVAENRPRTV